MGRNRISAVFKSIQIKMVNLTLAAILLTNAIVVAVPHAVAADPLPPAGLSFTDPVVACGGYTNSATEVATWTADPDAVSYNYRVWTTAAGSAYNSEANAFESTGLTTPSQSGDFNQGQGTYYAEVQSVDATNTASPWSAACGITYDTIAPVVTVTPVAGSLLHGSETFDITINDANPANPNNNEIYTYLYNANSPYKSVGANVDLSSGTGVFTADTTNLGDGPTWLDVGRLDDAAGNYSGTSDTYFANYTVDNTAPAVPTLTFPANGVWRQSSNSNYSSWTAVTDPSTPVTYYYESSTVTDFSTIAYASGPLTTTSINNPGEPQGTYYWRVKACDAATNCSAWSAPWTINIDNTPPVVTVTPVAGSLLHGSETFDITVTDAHLDPTALTHIYTYLYNDAGAQASVGANVDLSSGSASITLNTKDINDGLSSFDVGEVSDAAGNHTNGDTYFNGYVVDNTAPTVTVVTPEFATSSTPTITGTVNDPTADVEVTVGGHTYKATISGSNWSANVTNKLSDAVYTVGVTATDPATNVGTATGQLTVDAHQPGTPTILTPINNSYIDSKTPLLSWLPAFSITNPPVKYEVQVSTDKSFSNIVVDHTGTSFTDISSSLSDGVYYIRVQATDTLGGQSSWSSFNKFTVDTTNPVVSITSPANGKSVKGSVPVTGTFTDLNPAGYTWTITNSANHIVELKTFSGSSVAPLSLSKLADGTYTVTLEGFDLAGNHSSDSITINVDNTAPTISVDTLPLTSDNTPTITGKTDDPTAIITFTLNSDPTIYTATNNGDGTWSYTMPTVLSDGVYDISATATDPADNVGTATGSITVDAHQPGAPTLFTPSNNSYTNDNTPFINWKASSKTTNNPVTYTVEISSNSSFGSPTITSGLTTSSYTPASLSDGPYYVRVDTTDNLGAISGWSNVHEFTVDTINPVVKITSPHNYSHVKGSVEVNGTFSDLNPDHYSWTITKSGHKGDIYHHDFSGTTVAPLSLSKLADGTYTVTLEGFDLAGNHSSDSITITVDNTAPTASFTFPTTLGPTATSFTVQFDEAVKANEASNPANYFLNNWPGAQSFSSLAGNATVTYNNLTHVATVTFTNPGWYVSGEQQWGVKNIYDLAGNLINTNPTTAYSSPLTDPGLPGSPTTTTPTNNDSVTWTWTAATDLGVNPSGVKGYIYELLDSSSSVVVPYSTTPSSALSATTTVVADGTYTLNVEAVDNAGNVGPASTGTVIVDTVPPTLTINPSTSSTNTNPTITGTTSDSTDVVTVDGQLATVSTTPNLDGSFTWTYTLPTQTVGTHIVTVISTDLAGNAAQETANVVVSPIVTPSVALTTNGGGTTGNTNPGNTVTITPTGTVLGDSTTTPNGGNVKGDNTVNTDIKNTSNTKNSNFLGLGWWWLLVLAAVLGFGWFLFGRRKSDQDEA